MTSLMRISQVLAAISLSSAMVITGAGVTHAAPADFAAEGRAAGLTGGQIATLQNEANAYLAELGGNQVALNRIELDGATLSIALPGETQPRQLGAGVLDPNCDGGGADYRHFCAYRRINFTGTHIDMYHCGLYNIPQDWAGPGSWDNDQTTGTRARMYDLNGRLIHTTPPAHWSDPRGNWTPVWSVRNC